MSSTKYLLVAGARPNFMKIAPIRRAFSARRNGHSSAELLLVHNVKHDSRNCRTTSSAAPHPEPEINLEIGSGARMEQTARIMMAFERGMPGWNIGSDWVSVVGEVNSAVACALTAKKLGIRVAHPEAGLRSGDMSMPEERNRPVRTRFRTICLRPTPRPARTCALGVAAERTHFVGNTMIDTCSQQISRAREMPLTDDLVPE